MLGSERRPTKAQSTRIDSDEEPIDFPKPIQSVVIVTVPNLWQFQAHHQVQRMIPRLFQLMCSQVRSRMVSFLSFPQRGFDVVEGQGHANDCVSHSSQSICCIDAEIARSDQLEDDSESDTMSVGARHQDGPRQRHRFVLMSSGTVATAIDSPDSHEERFQRVRRAMQRRPVDPVQAAAQARIILKQALEVMWMQRSLSGRRHCGVAFASLDSIILPNLLKKRPSVMRSVPHFLKGPFRNALRLAMEEAVSEEVIRQERGWKLMLVAPTHVVAPKVPISCQRRVVDVVGGQRSL